jgi:glycosyltransferase involved in cell wall biosynthesis
MKILVLANDLTGLYSFRRELLKKLAENHEVICALPEDGSSEKLKDIGCDFIDITINKRGINPVKDALLLRKYTALFKQIKPDAVLTYTTKPNIYGGLVSRMFNVPYISNITGLGSAVEKEGWLQKLLLTMYKSALKKSACVFFQNEMNRKMMIEKKIVQTRYRMIPGSGVNLEHFQPLKYPDTSTINFLFVGRIIKEKGIDQYFDAAEYLKEKYPYVTFHMVGHLIEGEPSRLKELINKGIINFHGPQEDVRKFYSFTHCTIHPTFYPEGMSNVLLESAASARPAIATDRPGCREIIENNLNGFLIKEQDSSDLIEKIEKFLSLNFKEKQKLGEFGRKKVEREFDRCKVIAAYTEEIGNIKNNRETSKNRLSNMKKSTS